MSRPNYIDCGHSGRGHPTVPAAPYDWALPLNWVKDLERVLEEHRPGLYQPLGGHMVWRYGPEDGLFGRPFALCLPAKEILSAYSLAISGEA